jgi:hypothetical protein
MSRPPKDVSERRDQPITLKLSANDRALLGKLVEARAAELRDLAGQTVPVTIASLLRGLWERDAKERGLLPGGPKLRRRSSR